jgi:hypothetical protein
MPEGYYRPVAYPNRAELWLDKAAEDGQLVICQCRTCRRVVRYLASDLLPLLGADHRVMLTPPFPCRCGERKYISIKVETPSAGDYGSIDVRRPSGIKRTQLWRTVKLGDPVENREFGAPNGVAPKFLRDVINRRRRPTSEH